MAAIAMTVNPARSRISWLVTFGLISFSTFSAQLDTGSAKWLADHAQACYGGSVGKSMKSEELAVSQRDCWRKIVVHIREVPALLSVSKNRRRLPVEHLCNELGHHSGVR